MPCTTAVKRSRCGRRASCVLQHSKQQSQEGARELELIRQLRELLLSQHETTLRGRPSNPTPVREFSDLCVPLGAQRSNGMLDRLDALLAEAPDSTAS
jgi:hypothetical protein